MSDDELRSIFSGLRSLNYEVRREVVTPSHLVLYYVLLTQPIHDAELFFIQISTLTERILSFSAALCTVFL